jgi:hypothetical protein
MDDATEAQKNEKIQQLCFCKIACQKIINKLLNHVT